MPILIPPGIAELIAAIRREVIWRHNEKPQDEVDEVGLLLEQAADALGSQAAELELLTRVARGLAKGGVK